MNKMPLITVGMPVFNEVEYIEETIQRVISQSHSNFELIISDNNSCDGTREILEKYASIDSRISLIMQESNIGAVANINLLIKNSSGVFFILASGHDLWGGDLLEGLAFKLKENPNCILSYPTFERIDNKGNAIEWGSPRTHQDTSATSDPIRRFNAYLWSDQWPIYGLITLDSLKKTSGFKNIAVPGLVLMCELAILGRFAHVPEVVIEARQNRERESAKERKDRHKATMLIKSGGLLPHWFIPISLAFSCLKIPIKKRKHIRIRFFLLISCISSIARFHKLIVGDVGKFLKAGKK